MKIRNKETVIKHSLQVDYYSDLECLGGIRAKQPDASYQVSTKKFEELGCYKTKIKTTDDQPSEMLKIETIFRQRDSQ